MVTYRETTLCKRKDLPIGKHLTSVVTGVVLLLLDSYCHHSILVQVQDRFSVAHISQVTQSSNTLRQVNNSMDSWI